MKPSEIFIREIDKYTLLPSDITREIILAHIIDQMAEDTAMLKSMVNKLCLINVKDAQFITLFQSREWEK